METAPQFLLDLSFPYTVFLGISMMLLIVACNLQACTEGVVYTREFGLLPSKGHLRIELVLEELIQFRLALVPAPVACA